MEKKDNIDSWFFKNLVKGIIDSIILLLKLLRPKDIEPESPYEPKPNPYLPTKPWFPWIRKQIDTIISTDNKQDKPKKANSEE